MRSGLVSIAVVGLIAANWQASAVGRDAFGQLYERYDKGEYGAVVAAVDEFKLTGQILAQAQSDARNWIEAGGSTLKDHRALIVAAVALEIAHAHRQDKDQNPRLAILARFIAWACALVREQATPPSPAERWWYLASVGGLEEEDAWSLLDGVTRGPRDPLADLSKQEGPGGHLAHARARFPDEPRFRLAGLEVREDPTTPWAHRWTFQSDELCDAKIAALQTAMSKPPSNPGLTSAWQAFRSDAMEELAVASALPEIERDYVALSANESVRTEATLRAGYVRMRICDWNGALGYFSQLHGHNDDAFFAYMNDFLTGRALEQRGQRDAAMQAYDDALTVVPHAWSASTLLAAQLFLSDRSGDRERAFDVLKAAGPGPAPDDPWSLFRSGDARLWPDYMTHLREALR